MNDDERYQEVLKLSDKEWESRCHRCGACCGSTSDPCEQLRQNEQGLYYCNVYADRFGLRKTVGGTSFHCIPLRVILHLSWAGDENCGYKKT